MSEPKELTVEELDNVLNSLVLKDAVTCSILSGHITALNAKIKTLESGEAVRELLEALKDIEQHSRDNGSRYTARCAIYAARDTPQAQAGLRDAALFLEKRKDNALRGYIKRGEAVRELRERIKELEAKNAVEG